MIDCCLQYIAVVEVDFEGTEYSEEEGNSVEVCAILRGVALREVSAIFSTRPSVEGALGKQEYEQLKRGHKNMYPSKCVYNNYVLCNNIYGSVT